MDPGKPEEEPRQIVSFVSLGMVILDELRFHGQRPLTDVVGGSGAYGIQTRCCYYRSPRAYFDSLH